MVNVCGFAKYSRCFQEALELSATIHGEQTTNDLLRALFAEASGNGLPEVVEINATAMDNFRVDVLGQLATRCGECPMRSSAQILVDGQ